jgi:ribonuclease HII
VINAETTDRLEIEDPSSGVSLFDDLRVTELGLDFEQQAFVAGYRYVAGLDEVGRGCLAGPVVAAACILDPAKPLPEGLNDSKKLTPGVRERIAAELRHNCLGYAIGQIEADEIDQINILEATKQAMLIAIEKLTPQADFLLIDAIHLKQCPLPQRPIIRGDSLSASIAAASVIAKVFRDDLMRKYDGMYPEYGFGGHKGYAAPIHLESIRAHGPCAIHRLSFRRVVADSDPAVF